jgi:oligopeptide transport system substrate-binding protein
MDRQRLRHAFDPRRRAEQMQQAEALLLQDLPLIPLYHYTTQHLVSPAIDGWVDNVMDIHPSRYLRKHAH